MNQGQIPLEIGYVVLGNYLFVTGVQISYVFIDKQ